MKTEKQIRERIAGLEKYISFLQEFFDEYLSKNEDGSCFVREIQRSYKEIYSLRWVIG